MPKIQKGIYQHFKGKRYEVIDVAHHSETLETFVVYKALYAGTSSDPLIRCGDGEDQRNLRPSTVPEGSLWVRPLAMFQETVTVDGKQVPRFQYIE